MTKRTVNVHEFAFCKLTPRAQLWTSVLNDYVRKFPTTTFEQLAHAFGLSTSNARRYYYGLHQKNDSFGKGVYNQIRYGVCCSLKK